MWSDHRLAPSVRSKGSGGWVGSTICVVPMDGRSGRMRRDGVMAVPRGCQAPSATVTSSCMWPVAPLGNGALTLVGLHLAVAVGGPDGRAVAAGRRHPRRTATGARCRRERVGQLGLLPLAVVDLDLDLVDADGSGPRPRRRSATSPAGTRWQRCGGRRCGTAVLIGARSAQPRWIQYCVEVVEGRELDLGQPLGGRHVAVEAGDDEAGREAVLERAAARRSCRSASIAARPSHGRLDGEPGGEAVDRAADDLVGAGLHAGLLEQVAQGDAEPAGVADIRSPPTSLDTQVRVTSASIRSERRSSSS